MGKLLKRFLHKEKSSINGYVEYLRKIGVSIGEGTKIYDPVSTHIDEMRPYLIRIGKDCKIAKGVTILTHSGDWFVAHRVYGDVLGEADEVVIGDNVFIGMNVTILHGVHVGDNVIIGANSIVNKDLEGGYVYAGNPIRKIRSLEEHYNKIISEQLKRALSIYKNYYRVFQKNPPLEEFKEFFFLFCERDKPLPESLKKALIEQGVYHSSMKRFVETQPQFNGYDKFLEWCKNQ